MTIPKAPDGKPFTFAPSSIEAFKTCPAQYAAKYFYKTLPYVETAAAKAGNVEHKHLELRLKNNVALPEGYTRGEKYCKAIEAAGGETHAERELAINRDMKFVSWFAKDAYGRVKIDVASYFQTRVFIGDFKTGSVKEDSLQLKINACFLSLENRGMQEYITRYIWLKHDVTTGETFKDFQIPALWAEVFEWVHRMEKAWQEERFEPRKNGLCRNWCANSACKFCGK